MDTHVRQPVGLQYLGCGCERPHRITGTPILRHADQDGVVWESVCRWLGVMRPKAGLSGVWQRLDQMLNSDHPLIRRMVEYDATEREAVLSYVGDCEAPCVVEVQPVEAAKPNDPLWRAWLGLRCGKCGSCREARGRQRQMAANLECEAGPAHAPPELPAGDAWITPGHRTWMGTLTFGPKGREHLLARGPALREAAIDRFAVACREYAEKHLGGLAARQWARTAETILTDGVETLDMANATHRELRRMVSRYRLQRQGDEDAAFWLDRAALAEGRQFVRQLRRGSLQRSEGGMPLRYCLVLEHHKKGFPHLHLLVHERGREIQQKHLQSAWRKDWSGRVGGTEKEIQMRKRQIGTTEFALVGGWRNKPVRHRQNPEDAAAYVAKYVAKEGSGWSASNFYGQEAGFLRPGCNAEAAAMVNLRHKASIALMRDAMSSALLKSMGVPVPDEVREPDEEDET